jgi:ParB family transcriptional regulator, chromosome partitioning protein
MAESVRLVSPTKLDRNDENPRLIFREDELLALQKSIEEQGILVPLTVFAEGRRFTLIDGERRWRCALKLGIKNVPVIVQPKPARLQNIMMMFAIHKARSDWDPLPTAHKLQELEDELARQRGSRPSEADLAAAASLSRGEVRRYRTILALPKSFRDQLMSELEKPRAEQTLTVDHVLESTKGSLSLRKRNIIDRGEEQRLNRALVKKFRDAVITNTVEPRKLARIARAVESKRVSRAAARTVVKRLIEDPKYTVDRAFRDSVEQVDFEAGLEALIARVDEKVRQHSERGYIASKSLISAARRLMGALRALVSA